MPFLEEGVCRRSSRARPARYHPSHLASYLQVPQELEVLAARDVMSAPVVKLPEKALRYYHYSLWLHLLWLYTTMALLTNCLLHMAGARLAAACDSPADASQRVPDSGL